MYYYYPHMPRPNSATATRTAIIPLLRPLLLQLLLQCALAHTDEQVRYVQLQGGILHPAGFYLDAKLGGQPLKLQFDTSYSSVIVPDKDCKGCRVGDRRYSPSKSKGNATLIACDDPLCEKGTCSVLDGCTRCSRSGACCAHNDNSCAFFMKYGDGTTGNGSLYLDTLEFAGLKTKLPVGVVREVSHGFEHAYVDGTLGIAFEKGACHPGCTPPVFDYITNQTNTATVLTFCASRFGGNLAIANKPADKLKVDNAEWMWANVTDLEKDQRFVVRAHSEWTIGGVKVQLPGIAQALIAATTSSIAVGTPTMQQLQMHFLTHHCDVPKLCTFTSWFKPHRCVHFENRDLYKLPNITIPIAGLELTITPDDYLPRYRVVDGKMLRCVAFHVSDRLAAKGIGLVLGATVLRKYAAAFDRKKRRVAFAPANVGNCGPTNGSTDGLVGVAGAGLDASLPMLTAKSPPAKSNFSLDDNLARAEACGAISGCVQCAMSDACAFWYRTGRCVAASRATSFIWPHCTGSFCACWSVGTAGWYFGIAIGILTALALIVAALLMYAKRQRRYQQLDSLDNEQDIETF